MPVSPELERLLHHTEQAWNNFAEWDSCPPQFFAYMPPACIALEIPDSVWQMCDSHPVPMMKVLAANWPRFAGKLPETLPSQQLQPLQAMILIFETWGFDSRLAPVSPEQRQEQMDTAHARMIHAHPDRVENRLALAVDRNGNFMMLSRFRGDETAHTEPSIYGGAIIDAAQEFMKEVTAGC
jgi:hypothetical protein